MCRGVLIRDKYKDRDAGGGEPPGRLVCCLGTNLGAEGGTIVEDETLVSVKVS